MGDEAVWVEKTGCPRDGAARAVRAWADSRHCDFRGGAPLAALLKSVLDHHLHAVRGPAPDLSARSLGILLKGLSNEFPTRFAKCPGRRVGWRCAPLLSYLESSLLPPPPPPPPKSPARAAGRKRATPTVEPSPVKATATRSGRSSRRARHDDGT
mmetsp:Transcript_28851/g.102087  ORF Transcript_28851/g.102087 Transcript_28851/m.102087 type:complete len:155 (+) Transcript_28851:1752-2216(+)